MGYSIFTIAKDSNTASKMAEFLHKNYRGINVIINEKYPQYGVTEDDVRIALEDDISYLGDKKPYACVGFDYNTSAPARSFAFIIIKWMAKTIGDNPKCYYYDGEEMPINEKEYELDAQILYNANKGEEPLEYYISMLKQEEAGGWTRRCGIPPEEVLQMMDDELNRLDNLWNQSIAS